VFLKPTRNHFGIMGRSRQSEFEPAAIEAKMRATPSEIIDLDKADVACVQERQSTECSVI